jgi:hydroxyethylthiazole kinase-like uncharacterized protein yjeF
MVDRMGSFGEISLAGDSPQNWLLPSAAEMARLDRSTIALGTTALELMERAGAAVVERINVLLPSVKKCVVLCGPGNNGGDGLVIGRLLRTRGIAVEIVVAASERYSTECLAQLEKTAAVRAFGGSPGAAGGLAGDVSLSADVCLHEIGESELENVLRGADLVVDALLGTGQRSAPRGSIKILVEKLRASTSQDGRRAIVAVDIPTGLDADTGQLFDPHVQADYTVTVQYIKRGMLQFPGRDVCGAISAVPIGIAPEEGVEFSLVHDQSRPLASQRAPDIHKGLLGRVVVVGGSLTMPGAAMLSALGALRAGAGIVTRVIRRNWHTAPALPEAMYEVLEGDSDYFTGRDSEQVLSIVNRHDVVVLGPGLGTQPETALFVQAILEGVENSPVSVVLDADGLNVIVGNGLSLENCKAVLTPHPGEAARLLGVKPQDIQNDRFSAVRRLAECYGASVVLKGAGTLVHDGSRGRLIAEGTPYLATPGSGDVLAGIIAACTASSESIFDAASRGVWIHAKAGIKAAQITGGTILASDIALAAAACASLPS